jgi:hypothetical protein
VSSDPAPPASSDAPQPAGWQVRHAVATASAVALTAAVVVGRFGAAGVAGALLFSVGGGVLFVLCIAASVASMRGRVPTPEGQVKLISPIAVIVWSAGFIVLCVLAPVDAWLTTGDRSPWLVGAGVLAGAVVVVGIVIQVASLSDQWPDRWRPPYARQAAPGVDGPSGVGPPPCVGPSDLGEDDRPPGPDGRGEP